MTSPISNSNKNNFWGPKFWFLPSGQDAQNDDSYDGFENLRAETRGLGIDTFISSRKAKLFDEDFDEDVQSSNLPGNLTRQRIVITKKGKAKGIKPRKNKSKKTANYFLDIAEAILRAIKSVIKTIGLFINPTLMIAKYTQGSRLAKIAQSYAEAAVADITVRGTPDLLHRSLEVQGRAAAAVGEFDTMVMAWKNALMDNKQANQATHELFKRA